MPNPLKERVAAGQKTRALWLEAASPVLAEAAVYAGFRYLLIDNEHAPATLETTAHMARAIVAAGGHPMVRVAANDEAMLKGLLDIGITSIMVPRIESVAEADAAVAACRYPPRGRRGFAGEVRAARFGLNTRYGAEANEDLFLMLQIESAAGVAAAEGIAAVDGVDMVFPGPYDLSGSMGLPGQTGHADVLAAVDRVKAAAVDAGRPLGTVPHGPHSVADLMAAGFSLVIWNCEIGHAITAMKADADATPADWL